MKLMCIFLLSLIFFTAYAENAVDLYSFNQPSQTAQFNLLTQKLRCLVCQNESLADSNAPLAKDLRDQIAQMIREGKTNEEITDYLVNRYGNFVIYQPPFESATYILWLGPVVLLMICLLFLIRRFFR